MSFQFIRGNALHIPLRDNSVHCIVTSPPYWGLRDYSTKPQIWPSKQTICDGHEWTDLTYIRNNDKTAGRKQQTNIGSIGRDDPIVNSFCSKCGTWRGQLGLEPTPELYVQHLVEVFREVRRTLRSDGTLFLNMGDSYTSSGRSNRKESPGVGAKQAMEAPGRTLKWQAGSGHNFSWSIPSFGTFLKPKDLCGIPWQVAFALQDDGWYLRSDIIWCLSGGTWLYARTAAGIAPVMLKDLTRLRPETVELWTGKRWSKVAAWTKCAGRADAVELVLRSGERIGCTGNHVWPTARGNVRADALKVGDCIKTAKLPCGEHMPGWLTKDACWFAGLYLAEGSRSGETIQISGHVKEIHRLEKLSALCAHYGGAANAYTKGNGRNIHINSPALSAILRTLIAGRTAKDKHLTTAAWQYDDWALKQITLGYLEGDGHDSGGRVRLGFCRNYALEKDLRCLAARLGATLTIKPMVAKNQTGSFPAFRGEWRWNRSGHHNERDRTEIVQIRRSRARQFWDVAIVDEPHLFALASGVLTHNSKPNPMPESVADRPTKAHEYIFLLTKTSRYYFDQEAIKEPAEYDGRKDTMMKGSEKYKNGFVPNQSGQTFHARGHERWRWDDGKAYRNRRSVWTIPTEPFSGAHFAVFPQELPRICIAAGTSEKGCCPKCGTPWERILETPKAPIDVFTETKKPQDGFVSVNVTGKGMGQKYQNWRNANPAQTIDWRQACHCGTEHPISKAELEADPSLLDDFEIKPFSSMPCIVLDPFCGSGTTVAVAHKMGRHGIGIELSEKYLNGCAQRRMEKAGRLL